MASFSDLPPELVLRILNYLALPSLLSFARTSRSSLTLATASVHTLSLGIFPSRIASLIGKLSNSGATTPIAKRISIDERVTAVPKGDPYNDSDDSHTVSLIIPPEIAQSLNLITKFQNGLASLVVSRHALALRNIDLAIWSLDASTAEALAKCTRLRSLSLRLDHPYVRHRHIDRGYWDRAACEGSTVWNAFDGAWGSLQVIRLEGTGITDWQLQRILQANTAVKEIWVSNCRLLGKEFWRFLANEWEGRSGLRVLKFLATPNKEVDSSILNYVQNLAGLEYLSFHGCQHLRNDDIEQMNEDIWHINTVIMPQSLNNPAGFIEVDPAFMNSQSRSMEPALVHAQA